MKDVDDDVDDIDRDSNNAIGVHGPGPERGSMDPSDPAVKQFLLHLDEKMILGKKFVIDDLDETHLFVSAEIVSILQEKVWEIMDNNSFNITQNN
ncbi:General transcription factor IIH subunit 5 [Acropora cervicornis]|uniref:General transcription and DNA repair factor IIH subunit TFB5 n=1 Tax=Acropora cervicornis TaxID=6130 RepID=A0AAD9QAX8_ACRCE|nr:General transcription factor IIH subunit 5 [Acropora cervicornis]